MDGKIAEDGLDSLGVIFDAKSLSSAQLPDLELPAAIPEDSFEEWAGLAERELRALGYSCRGKGSGAARLVIHLLV